MRFNPRTREGCDLRGHLFYFGSILVSIHAPARGATRDSLMALWELRRFNPRTREGCDATELLNKGFSIRFNPRTREGCDRNLRMIADARVWFQSTHPRGVRRWYNRRVQRSPSFNPRTREGCDATSISGCSMRFRFQSTHPRGVRPGYGLAVSVPQATFQSTHPRGVRPTFAAGVAKLYKFQSTHPRGVRHERVEHLPAGAGSFNPRTREGCDPSTSTT